MPTTSTTAIVIGTRGSQLATTQTGHVHADLESRWGAEIDVRVDIIRTRGDIDRQSLSQIGGQGVFTREIEAALLDGRIDLAVHSLKDLPSSQPDGLCLAAVPTRHDPRDALLTLEGSTLDTLPRGATVATGSPRRRSQLLHQRPDLRFIAVRGNVDSRVRRLADREYDALILALAGVERLAIDSVAISPIDPGRCRPASGQGALGIETRSDDRATLALVEPIGDERSEVESLAERAFLRRLGGGCLAPASAWARVAGNSIEVQAVVASLDGRHLLCEIERGSTDQAHAIGTRLAERLFVAGAKRILDDARRELGQDETT